MGGTRWYGRIVGTILSFSALLPGCSSSDLTSAGKVQFVSVTLAGGAPEVRSRLLGVQVSLAAGASVRLAERAIDTATFRSADATSSWNLSSGDGPRWLLFQARYADGSLSRVDSVSIIIAEHVYASPTGSDANSGSYTLPKRHLTAAVATAQAEGRSHVRLFSGRFTPDEIDIFPIKMHSGLRFEAVSDGAATLDANGTANLLVIENVTGVVVKGLVLTNGLADAGGAVFARNSQAVIEATTITGNRAHSSGSAIQVIGGEVTLRRSVVYSNTRAGSSDTHGIAVLSGVLRAFNNVIALHDGNGVIVSGASRSEFRNNIFYANAGRGICELSGPFLPTLRYNLFFGNGFAVLFGPFGNLSGQQANDQSSTDDVLGNMDADPLFRNAATGDFVLKAGSPAVNAGEPGSDFNDADGSRNDIGHLGGPRIG